MDNPMADNGLISHDGVVSQITEKSVFVNITAMSACAHCQVKGSCNLTDKQEKLVEVPRPAENYEPGEQVTVYFKESLGFRALFLGYILPFLLLLVMLVAVLQITHNEAHAALAGLGALFPYYYLVYLKKDQLKKTFHFQIARKPISEPVYQAVHP